jgi:hypothetical protein
MIGEIFYYLFAAFAIQAWQLCIDRPEDLAKLSGGYCPECPFVFGHFRIYPN